MLFPLSLSVSASRTPTPSHFPPLLWSCDSLLCVSLPRCQPRQSTWLTQSRCPSQPVHQFPSASQLFSIRLSFLPFASGPHAITIVAFVTTTVKSHTFHHKHQLILPSSPPLPPPQQPLSRPPASSPQPLPSSLCCCIITCNLYPVDVLFSFHTITSPFHSHLPSLSFIPYLIFSPPLVPFLLH